MMARVGFVADAGEVVVAASRQTDRQTQSPANGLN